MRRQLVSIVVACVFYALWNVSDCEGKLCQSLVIRNDPRMLEVLRNCTVIVGYLQITLMEAETLKKEDFDGYVFPELTEITEYLVVFRLRHLTTLAKLFPNLSVIRGTSVFYDFSFIVFNCEDLKEIGLRKLYIQRGGVKIDQCASICYIKTMNWKAVGASKVHFNDGRSECPACPDQCKNGCWGADKCVEIDNDKKCHPECLGCSQYNSAQHCNACRNFNNNGTCVSECPSDKFTNRVAFLCMTAHECTTILNGTFWTHGNECLNLCRKPYYTDNKSCKLCDKYCKKPCKGGVIDKIDTLQRLRDCTHINGSIQIRQIIHKDVADELDALSEIRVINGTLQVMRSTAIKSLEFLKNLQQIKSLVVLETHNLQRLWNFTQKFNLKISEFISFQNNPDLCLSEIQKLAQLTGLAAQFNDPNDPRVSKYSNGDKASCLIVDMKVNVTEVSPYNVTLVWGDNSTISNTIYYIQHDKGNKSKFESDNVCSLQTWNSTYVLNNTIQITNLTPYTRYAYYIKTQQSVSVLGYQSPVMYFRTLSDDPEGVTSVQATAINDSVILLKWEKPKVTNGILDYYLINYYSEKDVEYFTDLRNYCEYPMTQSGSTVDTSLYNAPSVEKSSNDSDSCRCDNTTIDGDEVAFFNQDIYSGVCTKSSDLSCKQYSYNLLAPSMQHLHKLSKRTDSIKKAYKLANQFNEIRTNDPNLTSYKITHLRHFTMYVFFISACNRNDTKWRQCSEVKHIFQRTARRTNADDVVEFELKVVGLDVIVEWLQPAEPNGVIVSYNLEYKRLDQEHYKPQTRCISREQHYLNNYKYVMKNVPAGSYTLRVQAVSLAGKGRFTARQNFAVEPSAKSVWWWVLLVLLAILAVVGLVMFYWYKKKFARNNLPLITSVNPDYAAACYVEDEWTIERTDVELFKELGTGTFGSVYSGRIKSRHLYCALKTVNASVSVENQIEFLNEALVMKNISSAHHVVKLLGVVWKTPPVMVVMELMERGDLKSYLRRSRDSSQNLTSNEVYRMAIEIADGMAYLTSRKFVHRDLAARNCMVADDRTVKVGDFGMTRDVYSKDYYRKETKGLLPVRWMGPESLADGVFSSMSDVWSYGIVLWEIATLAEQPYQGLSNEQVLQYVTGKGKLGRPMECPDVLYEIMEACWSFRGKDRPSFLDIVGRLEGLVGQDFGLVSYFHNREADLYVDLPKGEKVYSRFNVSSEEVKLFSRDRPKV